MTDDGAETDLDLGHYERFITQTRMKKPTTSPPAASTKACWRRNAGRLPGQDRLQVIPHVTNEIQEFIKRGAGVITADAVDVAIVEIGGTVGDIESLPFLEAVRQMSLRLGPNNAAFVHLTYLPWIARRASSRPNRRSTRCRSCARSASSPTPCCAAPTAHARRRGAKRSPVHQRARMGRDQHVGRGHHLQGAAHAARAGPGRPDLRQAAPEHAAHQPQALGRSLVHDRAPQGEVTIAMVGKYVDLSGRHKSVNEALRHAGMQNHACA